MRALWLQVLVHLWQGTLVLGAVWLLDLTLARAPARFRARLWTAGLLKLALPASLVALVWHPAVGLLSASPAREGARPDTLEAVGRVVVPVVTPWNVSAGAGAGEAGVLFGALTGAWLGGALALLARGWTGRRRPPVGRGLDAADPPLRDRVLAALAGTGFEPRRVVLCDGPVMPSVRGLLRTTLMLPRRAVEGLSPDGLRAIVLHEEAHRRRRDVLRSAVEWVVASLLFFYPPVWWLRRRLDRYAEMACDEAVLEAGIEPRAYRRALAGTLALGLEPAASTGLAGRESVIGARLQRLRAPGRNVTMRRHHLAVAGAFALAVSLSLFAGPGAGAAVPTGGSPADESGGPSVAQSGGAAGQDGAARGPAAYLRLTGAEQRIDAVYRESDVFTVLTDLGRRAGFRVFVPGDGGGVLPPSERLSLRVSNLPLHRVLELVAEQTTAVIEVVDGATVSVRAPRAAEPGEGGVIVVRALDPEGRPLAGVLVSVVPPSGLEVPAGSGLAGERPTTWERTQYTAVDGTTRFPRLAPGEGYSVTFALDGFETLSRGELEVRARRTLGFDATMERSSGTRRSSGGEG